MCIKYNILLCTIDCKWEFWSCFVLFVFFVVVFLGMNEVSLLYLIPSLRAFWKLEGGCMGTVKTKGDSSQTLEQNNANAIYIYIYINYHRDLTVTLPCKSPKMLAWSWCAAEGRSILHASFALSVSMKRKMNVEIEFAVFFKLVMSVPESISCFSGTGLQKFLSPPVSDHH